MPAHRAQAPQEREVMSDINHLFASQHGVITRTQALGTGLSSSTIARLLAAGTWQRCHRGVYRHAAVPDSWEANVLAAVYATGGIASHRSAARLHGLDGFGRWTPEVTVRRPGGHRAPEVIVHESTQFDRVDPVIRHGIRCTGIDRTILDLGAVLRLPTLERAAESALRRRLTTWARLHATLSAHSRRGRNGCGVLRALLEYRHGSPVVPLSEWSRDVAERLVDAPVPAFELEYAVRDERGQHVLQVDIAFPTHRVAVELDSVEFHSGRAHMERDKRVRNELRRLGWVVVEITWREWSDDPAGVVRTIRGVLATRHPQHP
jgi:hypothetical protein